MFGNAYFVCFLNSQQESELTIGQGDLFEVKGDVVLFSEDVNRSARLREEV